MIRAIRAVIPITTILFVAHASAVQCPNYSDPSVPECPEIGLLSEQYPIAAVTVADDEGKAGFVGDYVLNVFKSQPKNPPIAYVSGSEETRKALLARIDREAPPGLKEKWKRQIRENGAKSYNWQQDFFESYHDKKTGRPALRRVRGYANGGFDADLEFPKMMQSMRGDCGIHEGQPLSLDGPIVDGMSGGNLEALGDFCIVGQDRLGERHAAYAKSACGDDPKNIVKAPTEFMAVGHTDEIFKTIPLPGKSPPCNVALAVASPRRAMELLEANGADKMLNRGADVRNSGSYGDVCDAFKKLKPTDSPAPTKGQSRLFELLAKRFSARAGIGVVADGDAGCDLSNADLAKTMKSDPELKALNEQVQARMNRFVGELKLRLAAKYPGCEPEVLEFPQLFVGGGDFENARALSLFPNPTNGEIVGKNYLQPQAGNDAFAKDMKEKLKKLGLEQKPINTDFAHRLQGNLHCSTHAIRYCRPKGRR